MPSYSGDLVDTYSVLLVSPRAGMTVWLETGRNTSLTQPKSYSFYKTPR